LLLFLSFYSAGEKAGGHTIVCKIALSDPGGIIAILGASAIQITVSILTTPGIPTTPTIAFKVVDDGVATLVII
jgi:hypothetical protein